MAAISWADVVSINPAATNTDAAAQIDILAHVNNVLAVDEFDGEDGVCTRLARMYLAAHHAAVIAQTCNAGAITSDKAGDLARAYANNIDSTNSVLLQGSAFGRMFLTMIRHSVIGVCVI